VLSNTIKQKRKEKAGKWEVPLPKVRPIAEDEMFRVMRSGKRMKKSWKRMITKATFVGEGFTRKPPKYERFIRPSGLRFGKAHITHPELNATFQLDILGVKKNPNGQMFTSLGVLTKGTVIEVNVSELGLVTPAGKVVWGKYAQITNNPENDGCAHAHAACGTTRPRMLDSHSVFFAFWAPKPYVTLLALPCSLAPDAPRCSAPLRPARPQLY
jgi:ribosome biogenesis protein NSA2